MEIAWVHGLLTMPYDATDVPESWADQRTDGVQEDHSHAIDFAVFEEMHRLWVPTVLRVFRWQLGCARRIAQS